MLPLIMTSPDPVSVRLPTPAARVMLLVTVKVPASAPIDASATTLSAPANVAEVAPEILLRAPEPLTPAPARDNGLVKLNDAPLRTKLPPCCAAIAAAPAPSDALVVATRAPLLISVSPV